MNNKEIENTRNQIDKIDSQILELLNDRADLSLKIRQLKRTDGSPLFSPEREEEIINKLKEQNDGKLYDQDVEKIFKLIMKLMREMPDD